MSTLLFTHPACLDHDTGPGHPESSQRLAAVLDVLKSSDFTALQWIEAPRIDPALLALVHSQAYQDTIRDFIPLNGLWNLDADTVVSPGSWEAALRAAGAVTAAVDAVIAGHACNAFCAVRPPGHHAGPVRPAGFCLLNNAVVGAMAAQVRHGLSRIAIVDFDVHHGDGTQAITWDQPGLFYASAHQYPFYPGTGGPDERGASGNIDNYPLAAGTSGVVFRRICETGLLPRLEAFAPELIIVSAGFDAHRDDPLGGLELDEDDFYWISTKLLDSAGRCCKGRLVATLEGGYDLDALGRSAASYIKAMLDHGPAR